MNGAAFKHPQTQAHRTHGEYVIFEELNERERYKNRTKLTENTELLIQFLPFIRLSTLFADWLLGRGHSARFYRRRYFIRCYCAGRVQCQTYVQVCGFLINFILLFPPIKVRR